MSERFRQVLEEASKQAKEWPDWKKSEALKRSEQALESKQGTTAQAENEVSNRTNSASAGK